MRKAAPILLLIAVGVVASWTLRAQAPADSSQSPSFEVASIKPNNSGSGGMTIGAPAGRFTAINVTVRGLILNAYDLPPLQILEGPPWTNSERFDILAKAESTIAPGQMTLMVRALLVDRFKFAAHTETRELPVYSLVLARADGKLGPGLRPSDIDCSKGRPAPVPGAAQGMRPCSMTGGPGRLHARSMNVDFISTNISGTVGRPVTDRTGLKGSFDVDLDWSPEQSVDTPGPSIYTAVQEQLGLKLESAREPKEVLVIDRVERPTPD